jgi:uncharacterized protein YnzC (UPF0291/DUF896 family)
MLTVDKVLRCNHLAHKKYFYNLTSEEIKELKLLQEEFGEASPPSPPI